MERISRDEWYDIALALQFYTQEMSLKSLDYSPAERKSAQYQKRAHDSYELLKKIVAERLHKIDRPCFAHVLD